MHRINASRAVLISGASGSGKSCLLRGLINQYRQTTRPVHFVDELALTTQSSVAIIDLLAGDLQDRMSTLSRAGLAEPKLWALPLSCVSVGQRSRVALALAMHAANPGDIVIADELCTPLDRASAYAIARTINRWATSKDITFIAATAHEDMESMLNPDLVVDLNAGAIRDAHPSCDQPIRIEPGSIEDYEALGHLHYLGPRPATQACILKATRTVPILGDILAGVLVVSMPTLNGSWRDRAWPDVFSTKDKRYNTQQINTHLRCISRVIVEPRSRGLGIASALVRAYLDSPMTIASEAVAAMGSACPFFERAGMTPYILEPSIADLRLIDAIEHERISLTDLIAQPIEKNTLIARELRTWAKTRKLIGSGPTTIQTLRELAPLAACRLISRPRAYAHTHKGEDDGEHKDQ